MALPPPSVTMDFNYGSVKRNPSQQVKGKTRRMRDVLIRAYSRYPKEASCPCRDCMEKRSSVAVSEAGRMLEVQSLYKPSSPQQPTVKRRRLRLSSVPLVDLRSTSLPGTNAECQEVQTRFSLTGSPNLHSLSRHQSKGGVCSLSEGMDSQRTASGSGTSVQPAGTLTSKIKHLTSSWEGESRFPKLDECAHFHYEFVELAPLEVCLYDETQENVKSLANGDQQVSSHFCVQITSGGKSWVVKRTYDNFRLLDQQLHQCIYDRKFSGLEELPKEEDIQDQESQDALKSQLDDYLLRFSTIAGNLINCGPVLNWLELDNRGNRLIVTDDSAINTPAVAAAYVVKRYTAQASDEISFEVGDMISVIDMPPPEESIWWRGKKGFEVGFFPCECVEVIGDKVPQSMNIPKAPTKPVLRKHGKLISFFRAFILSRPSRRKLKQSGILKERVFGCDLGEHLLNSGHEIPIVLKYCTQFIEEHGVVDGIYRLSGVTSNIQKLRNAFDEDRVPQLRDDAILQDIHCVASLLKMYFRELPNPLLTYQLYDKFVAAVQSEETQRLLNMRDVVQQLPPPHYRTLEYLIRHLARVASFGSETGMTPKNVAIVWAPNLLRSKELEIGSVAALQVVGVQAIVTEYLIRYVQLIFNEKLPVFPATSSVAADTPKKTRPKSLAISTPTKLLSLEEARSRALSSGSQSQQQYIEVGGGPANLPSKYHTVIELPDRKRGSTKLKKSPSGWKSFFSKNKSQSQSSKEKGKAQRKISSPILQMPSSLAPTEKAFTETDMAQSRGKRLRSVKSAESLISSVGGTVSHRNSDVFDLGPDISEGSSRTGINRVAFDLPVNLLASKGSPHTHVRSVSHDSYFECSPDIPRDSSETVASDPLKISLEQDNKSERLVLDDFEDVADDMNHIHATYDDLDFVSTGSEPLEDTDSIGKSPKKHRWKTVGSLSPKSKLGLKDKLKHAFTSPPTNRRTDSSCSDASEESSLRGSLRRPTSSLKDKIYSALSPESLRRRQATGADNSSVNETKPTSMNVESTQTDSSSNLEQIVASPEGDNLEIKSDITASIEDLEETDTQNSVVASVSKVIVERYGSEKTIIVEVHATQESEEEEQNVESGVELKSLWSVDKEKEASQSPVSYHSSVMGEYGSPTSAAATASDDESLSALDTLDIKDDIVDLSNEFTISNPSLDLADIPHLSTKTVTVVENTEEQKIRPLSFASSCSEEDKGEANNESCDEEKITNTSESFIADLEELAERNLAKDRIVEQANLYPVTITTPIDKLDSESSTPSIATPSDAAVSSGHESGLNLFGYSVLVNETDGGSGGDEASPETDPALPQDEETGQADDVFSSSCDSTTCSFGVLQRTTVETQLSPECVFSPQQDVTLTTGTISEESLPEENCVQSIPEELPLEESSLQHSSVTADIDSTPEDCVFGLTEVIESCCNSSQDSLTNQLFPVDSPIEVGGHQFSVAELVSEVNSLTEPLLDETGSLESLPSQQKNVNTEETTIKKQVFSAPPSLLDTVLQEEAFLGAFFGKTGQEVTIPVENFCDTFVLPEASLVKEEESALGELLPEVFPCEDSSLEESPTAYDEPTEALKTWRTEECDVTYPAQVERHLISPLDDTKRRFESEIGRDILHERKMRLELEKIQSEQRMMETAMPCRSDQASCPRALPSPLGIRSPLFLQLEISDGVELRRPHPHSDTVVPSSPQPEDTKRNSEPLPSSNLCGTLERKRLSEPCRLQPEKKASVRELLCKFESPTLPDGPELPTNQKSKHSRISSVSSASESLVPEVQGESCAREDIGPALASKPPTTPAPSTKSSTASVRVSCTVDADGKSMVSVKSKDRLALRFSAPLELTPALAPTQSSDTFVEEVSDAARRERIDKYKEERRAQLREKIRSDSFKMDKDERSEYLTKLRGKVTSPTRAVEPNPLRKSSPSALAISPSADRSGSRAIPPRSPKRTYGLRQPKEEFREELPSPNSKGSKSPCDDGSIPSFIRHLPGRRSLRTGSESEALEALRKEATSPEKQPLRRRGSLAKDGIVSPPKPKDLPLWEKSTRPRSPTKECRTRELSSWDKSPRSPTKGAQIKDLPSPRSPTKGGPPTPTEAKVTPPPRRIRQVAAMFERETAEATNLPVSRVSRARFLSHGSDDRRGDSVGKSEVRKKASQYLSAV